MVLPETDSILLVKKRQLASNSDCSQSDMFIFTLKQTKQTSPCMIKHDKVKKTNYFLIFDFLAVFWEVTLKMLTLKVNRIQNSSHFQN